MLHKKILKYNLLILYYLYVKKRMQRCKRRSQSKEISTYTILLVIDICSQQINRI